MAVRTIACLPAVVGAWREVGGGALLSTSGTFPVDTDALERPDLIRPGTRTLNMSQLGRILEDQALAPPVKALFVYNSNPGAVAPDQESVRRGLAREDLFTIVHEQFQTDTADFADLLLPATTTLEHYDIHKAYGHLYISLSRPAIAPAGRGALEHGALPPPRRAHGARRPVPARVGRGDGAAGVQVGPPAHGRDHVRAARARDVGAPERAGPVPAVRRGRLPDGIGPLRAGLGQARRPRGSTRWPATSRRARARRARRRSPSASRSRSSRRPRTTS